MKEVKLRPCRCGAAIGALHEPGCDKEICARCGGQSIVCDCIYELNGLDLETLEEQHIEIYENGPTPAMEVLFDAEIARLGGRIPWSGEFPGGAEARELNLWCRLAPGRGWVECEASHPDATEDLNRLHVMTVWDPVARKRVRRIKGHRNESRSVFAAGALTLRFTNTAPSVPMKKPDEE